MHTHILTYEAVHPVKQIFWTLDPRFVVFFKARVTPLRPGPRGSFGTLDGIKAFIHGFFILAVKASTPWTP